MSASRRLQLLDWAQNSGSWIIEDDYDSEFRYESNPIPSLHGNNRPFRRQFAPCASLYAHLTQEWVEYSIDLEDANLTYLIGGFAWTARKELNPNGVTFYLDEIRFERQ